MHGVMRYMTNYPDRFHHPKEDLVFRKLVERDPSCGPQVDHLLGDHVQILAQGAELLALIDRCRADPKRAETFVLRKSAHKYIGHLRRHMDVEELRLFPRAQQVLRPEDWAEIDANMRPILDPVFGETVAAEFRALRAHEDFSHGGGRRGAPRSGWVEAAAVIESVSALLAGATKANAKLSRHHREALSTNAAFLRDLLSAQPFGRRVGLVRKACARNSQMARDITRLLGDVWSETFKAARRPYREKGTHAAK
jgi:hemerythrin-like domain-containing protein